MKQKEQSRSFDDLVKRLEAERYDITYRKPLAEPQPVIKVKTVNKIPERLKKIYFHAGRYSAGDRDTMAVEANAAMEKLES